MTGYTKLFGSIVASTIWTEDDKTRIVWITMLAMANQHGEVEASIPGLAKFAQVSVQDTEAALAKLSAPDKYSRSKENDGRRIADIDGGWLILNHGKYREKASEVDRRAQDAIRQQRQRDKKKNDPPEPPPVTDSHAPSRSVTPNHDKQKQTQMQVLSLETEPPAGFPRTEEEAKHHAAFVGCPEEFAVTTYHLAVSRGFHDSKDVLIRNFRSHLKTAHTYATERDRYARKQGRDRNDGQIKPTGDLGAEARAKGKVR